MADEHLADSLRLCDEALAREDADRAAYLDAACGADTALRREVDALLAERSAAAGFLDTPAWTPHRPPLAAGTRLGPYQIEALIGAGGMGEVYRARDTRLDRTVAIKVLPPAFAADPARRVRFEREAKTIAGLNHPHICALHDVGQGQGFDYLVMEHLEGQTLAERLRKGPLSTEHALTVAEQIADALAAAHRQGIVHRDLKPANVMLTKMGAKLLDFGLAKLRAHGEQPVASSLAQAERSSASLTGEGAIVGTLQYMAPEQLEGKPADARTDLWALGAILHEMVAGTRAFEGTSQASLIAAIMSTEPPALTRVKPLTPAPLAHVVARCLAKDPEARWQAASDVARELRWVHETNGTSLATVDSARRRWRRQLAPIASVGVICVLAGAGLMRLVGPGRTAAPAVSRASLDARPAEEFSSGADRPAVTRTRGGSETALAWTPDGRTLVFIGRRAGTRQIYLRALDQDEARPLAGTEGARALAVSADGQWVAFWTNGRLKKTPLAGGPAAEVAALSQCPKGLAWDTSGNLIFADPSGTIGQVSVDGHRTVVVGEDGESTGVRYWFPDLLPNGRVLLFTIRKRPHIGWGDEEVVAQTLATGERKPLLTNAADARYVPTGHLVFMRLGRLFGVAFDAERAEKRGPEVPLLDDVSQALISSYGGDATGAGQYAFSPTGTLAYVRGVDLAYPERTLVWVDRRGTVSPADPSPRSYGVGAILLRDGRTAVTAIQTLAGERRWVCDLAKGTCEPVGRDVEVSYGAVSPDGQRVAFDWRKNGSHSLAWQRVDGTAQPEVLAPGRLVPCSWSQDGRRLAGVIPRSPGIPDALAVVAFESGPARVEVLSEATEYGPQFSPDGHWLAYSSAVSRRREIYVRPYPGPGPGTRVSVDGGSAPAWTKQGRELIFVSLPDAAGRRRMMAADFTPASPPRPGAPRMLFEFDGAALGSDAVLCRAYDVTDDGQRFLMTQKVPTTAPEPVTHINLILNWFEELKAKVPVKQGQGTGR